MKTFSQIREAVNPAANTPFERAVRAAHPVVTVDVPPEMSGDNFSGDMPPDRSRAADQKCTCDDPSNCTCDDEMTDIHEQTQTIYEAYGVISEDYEPITDLVMEIAQTWKSFDPHKLDPVVLEVLREDFQAIRDYLVESLDDEEETGLPADVSFQPPVSKPKRKVTGADTPLAPIDVKPIPTPGKYDKSGLKFVDTEVFDESFIPGKFKLKDGAEVSLNDADAHLLNRLHTSLTPANSKALGEKITKNFHNFQEILEFARAAIDGDDK